MIVKSILASLFLALSACSFDTAYDVVSLVFLKNQLSLEDRLEEFEGKKWNTKKPVKISWDKYAVPYIKAETDRDLFYATGAVQAHLRGAQLELFRRLSQGRLAELIGKKAFDIDVFVRTVDVGKNADKIIKGMPFELRHNVEAFVKGINDYNKQLERLPVDLKLMGVEKLEPWTLKELIYVHRLMGIDVNWKLWPDLVRAFNEIEDDAYTSYWKKWVKPLFSKKAGISFIDSVTEAGSNAFAISGTKTTTGKVIVAGDPHLGLTVPNFWIFIHQESPSIKTLGITMPSFPLSAMGRNRNIAWTGTNMWGLSSYLHELSEEDIKTSTRRKEVFKSRFSDDVVIQILESKYGPVISNTGLMKSKKHLAMSWAGHQESSEIEAFYKANIAEDIESFKKAFEDYGVVALNYVVGDKAGNIAKIHVAKLPVLKTEASGFIQGKGNKIVNYYNVNDFPESINPKRGFLVSSNESLKVKGKKACWFCSVGERHSRISELLEKKLISVDDVKSIQQDVLYKDAKKVIDRFFNVYGERKLRLPKKFEQLLNWDLNYGAESEEPYIFEEMVKGLAELVYNEKGFSKAQRDLAFAHYSWRLSIFKNFRELPIGPQMRVLKKLTSRVNRLRAKPWGSVHKIKIAHPFGSLPVIGSFFTLYKGAYPGSVATVFKAAFNDHTKGYKVNFGANLRIIFDLSENDANYGVLLGGQDGFWGSEQIKDQVKPWMRGEYIKLPYTETGVLKVLKHETLLN
ncbi:MAG: penicillin acylase family protein [Bdellovibrionales bacterium]